MEPRLRTDGEDDEMEEANLSERARTGKLIDDGYGPSITAKNEPISPESSSLEFTWKDLPFTIDIPSYFPKPVNEKPDPWTHSFLVNRPFASFMSRVLFLMTIVDFSPVLIMTPL